MTDKERDILIERATLVELIRVYGDACTAQGLACGMAESVWSDLTKARSAARSVAFNAVLDAIYPSRTKPTTEERDALFSQRPS